MKVRLFVAVVAMTLAITRVSGAQLAGGTVSGTITDQQSAVLPGVTVTAQGVDAKQTFTTDSGGMYRFLNLAPGPYKITAALQGFTTVVREGVIVEVGKNVDLPIQMKVAAVAETITVSRESPVIDTKQMGTATNFTQDELSRIPNSRDPWALLRTVPGVSLDRVNIAGNETGQQAGFVSKGGRQGDAVWTMDGIPITDMATNGASPTYFDYDAFAEIQISTGGNDIRQPTGAVGLNFVVKRGTNQLKGTARGYFTNDSLEATNLPAELKARGITRQTADHNQQISDAGADVGGPIIKDRLFAWGSYTKQDIRLFRQSAKGIDQTILKTYNAKGTWQATQKDMVNFLFFNGDKVKHGRATGLESFEPPSARWEQHNFYEDNPFHGLWKLEENRVFGSSLFITGKYAYYNTGFTLESPDSSKQYGVSRILAQTFGSANSQFFKRPQHTVNIDGNHFRNAMGFEHNFKFGMGWRRTEAFAQNLYPGNKIVAYENNATDFRARVYREGAGRNRSEYFNLYVGDTITKDRMTVDLGVRYDRQWGLALPSTTRPNDAFPNLVPGFSFAGYDPPFYWNNVTPRVGFTYALDASHKTIARASYSRNAGQLSNINGVIGYANPSSVPGWVEYRWEDRDGDHFAEANEVRVDLPILASGNGFNTANPTAATSANRIDSNLKAPVSNGVVVGVDRELMPNLALQVNYTYTRTRSHAYTPFIGLTNADYAPGPGSPLTGTLPDGTAYTIPTFVPDAVKVGAVGGGRVYTNFPGYYTTFHGIEVSVNKRLSDRWMMRLAAAYNNPREFYDPNLRVSGISSINNDGSGAGAGNPTALDEYPLVQGGQVAPRSGGSGSGDIFINQKWNFNVNGAYQLPWDLEAAGNLFAKQGTPYPYFQQVALGRDGSQRVLVTPLVDSVRFSTLTDLDVRLSKNVRFSRGTLQLIADLFNVLNSNTEINRVRNIKAVGATPFGALTSNLSPRIFRFGARISF
jgi:hypothetical protein